MSLTVGFMRRAWQPTPVFLPGESPWTEEPGGLQSMGSQRVGHDWATKPSTVGFILSYHFILLASILSFHWRTPLAFLIRQWLWWWTPAFVCSSILKTIFAGQSILGCQFCFVFFSILYFEYSIPFSLSLQGFCWEICV